MKMGKVENAKKSIEILISNAWIITMNKERQELANASIAIDGGEILDLGPTGPMDQKYNPKHKIDASEMVVLPGLVNAHNHLFQTMCRGLGDGLDISDWANRAIWPVAPYFGQSACEVAASLACLEMIESGTTTVVDSHYLHADKNAHDGIAQACLNSGMRAILGRASFDLPSVPEPFREAPEVAAKATGRLIQKWNGKGNRLIVRTEVMNEVQASREMILRLRKLSREAETGFHMHAASSRSRPEWLKKEVGFRTIEYLNHLGVLGPDVVLAHCVWLNYEEKRMMAESQTAVSHNPVSNQYLADGVAPVPEFLEMGIRVGIGTDGAGSNNSQDMFEAMKATALLHKVHNLRANVMGAPEVLELATIKGAEALGIDHITGSVEPGKRADILLVSRTSLGMIPCYSIASNLVYSATSKIVDTVIIEGKIVAEKGECVSLDKKDVLKEAVRLEKFLKVKMKN